MWTRAIGTRFFLPVLHLLAVRTRPTSDNRPNTRIFLRSASIPFERKSILARHPVREAIEKNGAPCEGCQLHNCNLRRKRTASLNSPGGPAARRALCVRLNGKNRANLSPRRASGCGQGQRDSRSASRQGATCTPTDFRHTLQI